MTDAIPKGLTGLWGGRMWFFDEIPSTNTWAIEHADTLQHGDVIWAVTQSAGRGRMGRGWMSVPGRCLTISLVVAESEFAPLAPNLCQLTAWAVLDTIRGMGIVDVRLKWPNDVMVNDRKVAGLLAEHVPVSQVYVVGVGLNVNVTKAELDAARLDRPATSLLEAAGRESDLGTVRQDLLSNVAKRLDQARREGTRPLWAAWGQHDWLRGRRIRVTGLDRQIEGEYRGLDEYGRLIILGDDGVEQSLWSGDVERIRETVDGVGSPGTELEFAL